MKIASHPSAILTVELDGTRRAISDPATRTRHIPAAIIWRLIAVHGIVAAIVAGHHMVRQFGKQSGIVHRLVHTSQHGPASHQAPQSIAGSGRDAGEWMRRRRRCIDDPKAPTRDRRPSSRQFITLKSVV